MRIAITLLIDVDPAKWDAVHGHGSAQAEVREDVRSYVLTSVQGSAGMEGSGADVTLK